MTAAKPATMVDPEVSIRVRPEAGRYVGRGGLKLEAALDAFGLDVRGKRALDVGASTGGFSDCLLAHGAASVVALDVGYGQLAWKLRTDERVDVVEKVNFRNADADALGAPFDVVVVDLSFISLETVAAKLREVGDDSTDYVLLVKPQFEVGKGDVGKGGIVRDPALHAAALERVAGALDLVGIGVSAAVASPVTGAKGNVEFLARAGLGKRSLTETEIEEVTSV